MSKYTENLPLDQSFTLESFEGPITIEAKNLQLISDPETHQWERVTLTAHVDFPIWQRIDTQEVFHLTQQTRGPMPPFAELKAGEPVELDLVLEPILLKQLPPSIKTLTDLANMLLKQPSPTGSEDWYAVHVKQQRGAMKVGFRSEWYDSV